MKCVTESRGKFFSFCSLVSGTPIPLQAIPPPATTVQPTFELEVTWATVIAGHDSTARARTKSYAYSSPRWPAFYLGRKLGEESQSASLSQTGDSTTLRFFF